MFQRQVNDVNAVDLNTGFCCRHQSLMLNLKSLLQPFVLTNVIDSVD